MNRREAVQQIALLLGGSVLGANAFLTGCNTAGDKKVNFSKAEVAFLDEIADTILPATKTPGGKAAHCGEFMKGMVSDCYDELDQKVFKDGMATIDDLSKIEYGEEFTDITPEQRHVLLVKLDNEQKTAMKSWKDGEPKHYFRLMKELTLLGYFTSEIGCTQAKRYVEIPGRFEGCIPYKKGDRAFA